jgi:hypothetical protein
LKQPKQRKHSDSCRILSSNKHNKHNSSACCYCLLCGTPHHTNLLAQTSLQLLNILGERVNPGVLWVSSAAITSGAAQSRLTGNGSGGLDDGLP